MKRTILIGMLLVVVLSVLVVGCAKPAPAPAPTPAPAPAPAPKETVTLKIITYAPVTKVDPNLEITRMLIERVEEQSGGQIKMEVVGGPEVTATGEQMEALSKGIFDIVVTAAYHMSAVPEIRTLNIATITPQEQRETGYWDALNEAHKEKMGIVYMGRLATESAYYLYSNKMINSMEDFKGMKMRSIAMYEPFLKALGVTPVTMPMTEIYTAMERGLIEGFAFPYTIHRISVEEVTKYRINHPFYTGSTTAWYMNQEEYEGLPTDVRKVLDEAAKWIEHELAAVGQKYQAQEDKYALDAGMEFITIPDGEELVDVIHAKAWETVYEELPDTAAEWEKMSTDPSYRP